MMLAEDNDDQTPGPDAQLLKDENEMAETLKFNNKLTLVNKCFINPVLHTTNQDNVVSSWSGEDTGGTQVSVNLTKDSGFQRTPTKSLRMKNGY